MEKEVKGWNSLLLMLELTFRIVWQEEPAKDVMRFGRG
jgi:hypothetical protein